jgi:hypothetical protein
MISDKKPDRVKVVGTTQALKKAASLITGNDNEKKNSLN